jgi:hypothetical protein
VVKIAFFILDHLGGDVAHDGKIPHISTGATMIPKHFHISNKNEIYYRTGNYQPSHPEGWQGTSPGSALD